MLNFNETAFGVNANTDRQVDVAFNEAGMRVSNGWSYKKTYLS